MAGSRKQQVQHQNAVALALLKLLLGNRGLFCRRVLKLYLFSKL